MTALAPALNPISRIPPPFLSLNAAAAPADGDVINFPRPMKIISLQGVFTGGSPTVKIFLEGSIDGVDWMSIATFDTGGSSISGTIVTASTFSVLYARAVLDTLSGGTNPTVSAMILAHE